MRLLFVCFYISSACAFNFNTNNVREIRSRSNSYFGYSLLLQKGSQPVVIVGAPRQSDGHFGGALHHCTLEGRCSEFAVPTRNQKAPDSSIGNFLGAALDGSENTGEQLIACAPRVVTITGENYFLNGWCFLKENSSSYNSVTRTIINPLQKEIAISRASISSSYYYDNAFGDAGLDVHYLKETREVLLGAPGIKNWNGAIVVQSLSDLNSYRIIPVRSAPFLDQNYGYLGYKVTSAKFDPSRKTVSYIAGAPRANQLFGNVKIYDNAGNLKMTLTGDEMGSYFGSSILAVDVNNDHIDDLFIGAPMGAGTSWDEGHIYFYKTYQSKFETPVKLVGSKKAGARFGTAIVSLGDIDLDSYNDIAVSAPYEDDGVGAVYIYRGSRTGINLMYTQRLSPLSFSHNFGHVRGFGQSLSSGVDIDGNGHNDLAVGAYKSDQVFIITTTTIIDYELSLDSNLTSISTSNMNIKYCVYYTQRSKTHDLINVQFKVVLSLDYRVDGETQVTDVLNVQLSKSSCKSRDVKVKQSSLDISPFKMSLKSEIQQANLIGLGEDKIEKSIPYSHGCGDDNICQTKILVTAITTLTEIVLGANKEIDVTVTADNVGEPGYACKMYINFPNVLELRDTRDCSLENSTYECPFASRLMAMIPKEMQFKFDIKLKKPGIDKVVISFEVKCLGEELGETKSEVSLNVLLQNSPHIQGSSVPNNFYFDDDNMKDVEISHLFKIGNYGPSPVKLAVFLLLPMIKKDVVNIFDVEAKGSLNGIQVQCYPTNRTVEIDEGYDVGSVMTESENKTVVIDCFGDGIECLQLFCDGEYLYKSTEIAEYNVKIQMITNLLALHYHDQLQKKGILAYISTVYLYGSGDKRVEGYSSTLIYASGKKPVPIWVYIVATIVGVLLLALLIFLLYKCHFFDRNYRDKLKDEKLMDKTNEDDDKTDKMEESPSF